MSSVMSKKTHLDDFEQDIEDHFESLSPVHDIESEMMKLRSAALSHSRRKKAITLRVHEADLEAMRIKASKLGIPYQTYINMLIHKDATSGV
ncbi:MAG: CopG family antitoxin [Alphaproteobacteria bacterium]|jgi:predicted DNA binding CopG/RHH family protein